VRAVALMLFAVALIAARTFGRNDSPAGHWDGMVERDGLPKPMTVQLVQSAGRWRGRIEVDGASSPADGIRVAGKSVHFELSSSEVFDGAISGNSMTGDLSGSGKSGSFALTREELMESTFDAIPTESEGP
jgi:hypothetical protein